MSKVKFFPRKVLISTGELFRYIHGANMVFLELAEYFLSKDCEVVIYANLALPPMLDEALRLPGAEKLSIIDDPDKIVDDDFDLIFMHDNTLPDNIVKGLSEGLRTRIVPLHLSPIVPIEMPLFAGVENSIADVIACVSEESAEEMIRRGLDRKKLWVMENFVPISMHDTYEYKGNDTLQSLAIVTNHLPKELEGVIKLLRKSGIQVDHFGAGGNKLVKISAEILTQYDAVMSIGKTVQYALSLGIPVYLYDHFGGPGWLNATNFENQLAYNLSGRATGEQKKARQIVKELIDGYKTAHRYALANQIEFQTRFSIETKMSTLLSKLPVRPSVKKISSTDELAWNNFNQIYRGMYRGFEYYKDQSLK